MLKKVLLVALGLFMSAGLAFAQVDVNTATPAALEGIKGIGQSTSKRITEERKKAQFKDWPDFEARVAGIGEKKAAALSAAGLTVNGVARAAAAPKPVKTSQAKPAAAK